MKQGTMRNVKKGLGFALAIMVLNYFYPIEFISNLEFLHLPIMAISAFFLIKSGNKQ